MTIEIKLGTALHEVMDLATSDRVAAFMQRPRPIVKRPARRWYRG